ncbi:unnamed protein product, partial [Prunus brigantina]
DGFWHSEVPCYSRFSCQRNWWSICSYQWSHMSALTHWIGLQKALRFMLLR